ncbi:probable pathogenesis-related protein ARB_02861 isoform X2 [Nilaparvata lugens]|nr:probable pathogenesis-related protein ARB_02861 isoform X2 [Nilaparvata lugens]XP_039293113.1 probable pathogenesis-related protein ARB_02861 isoform X2 [Nilaparvata lugens]
MVTPVHRFQPIECVAANAHAHSSQRRSNGRGTTTELPTRSHAVELDSSVFLDLPLDGGGGASGMEVGTGGVTDPAPPQLPPSTTLDPAAVAKQSVCGLRLSFALLTALIGGARLYADYQGTGTEVLYTLFLIAVVTLCAATLYRSMLKRTLAAEPAINGLAVRSLASADGGDLTPPSLRHAPLQAPPTTPPPPPLAHPLHLAEPPPPPYHIAVLLPQHEAPPPSYDKAIIGS